MATARKLPSGNYRCRVYLGKVNGKDTYKSFTASTKKEAERIATNFLADYDEKKKVIPKNEIPFHDALTTYISKREPVLSPSTIKEYKGLQRNLKDKFPVFCNMRVCDITQDDVQDVINDLSTKLSPKTVRNYHGIISSILGKEIVLKTTMPQKETPNLYIPKDDDIKKLIKIVENTEMEIPILLGAFGMMRRGEICSLSIDDVDFKNNTIHVHHSMVKGPDKKWHIKAPKNQTSDRYVHVPDFVVDKIKAKGYITTYKPGSITDTLKEILEANNLPHFRFHDLRHYSASIRHALNIPDAYIMEEGGWKTDNVLKTVYRHAMKDKTNEMTVKAINHFDKLYDTKHDTNEKEP